MVYFRLISYTDAAAIIFSIDYSQMVSLYNEPNDLSHQIKCIC